MCRWLVIAPCVLAFACGGGGTRDEESVGTPVLGGAYAVTATPPSQACGAATITLTAESVYFLETEEDATDAVAIWGGTAVLELVPVSFDGGHFIATWASQRIDAIPCPATGASQVTTTFTYVWTGDGDALGFQSALFQEIASDCDVSSCFVIWDLVGTRSTAAQTTALAPQRPKALLFALEM